MARTITWDDLRELAGFSAEKGFAISLYLTLDPSVTPTAANLETRLNSLLDQAGKAESANGRDLTHEQKLGLRADFDRIRRFLDEDFNRTGNQGLAIFCDGLDNVWRVLPLTDAVSDAVKVSSRLYLAPLVPLVGRGDGAVVVVVGREQGRFYRLRGGRLEELADHFEEQPRRHDQGGWSQARMQRHVDGLAQDHLRDVAEVLDRYVRQDRSSEVVVVATDESRAEFSDVLSQESRNAIVGWAQAEAHAGSTQLLAEIEPILEQRRTVRETEMLERWRQEAGRDGRASAGWRDTLEAASDGRIELLLFQDGGSDREAWQCPACGRLSASAGKCPLDGTQLERRAEGIDLAVHQTLAHGGTVWAVRGRQDLEPVEGIGALLRF
jgi:peptide chain release factor subunit 1